MNSLSLSFGSNPLGMDLGVFVAMHNHLHEALSGLDEPRETDRSLKNEQRAALLVQRYNELDAAIWRYSSLPAAWSRLPTRPFTALDAALDTLLAEARTWLKALEPSPEDDLFTPALQRQRSSECAFVVPFARMFAERTLRLDAWLRQGGELPNDWMYAVVLGVPTAFLQDDARYRPLREAVDADLQARFVSNPAKRTTSSCPCAPGKDLDDGWPSPPWKTSTPRPAFRCEGSPVAHKHRALYDLRMARIDDWMNFGPLRRAFDEARSAP